MSGTSNPGRTVVIPSYGQTVRGILAIDPIPLSFGAKAPLAVLPYTIDLSQWLLSGDTVLTIFPSISPQTVSTDAGVIKANASGTMLTLVVAGGTQGVTYALTAQVSTVGGLSDVFSVLLPVNSNSPSTTPSAALTAQIIGNQSLAAALNLLPTTDPGNGGYWLNDGIPTQGSMTGTPTPPPVGVITNQIIVNQALEAVFNTLPTTDPGPGGGYWLNDGIPTQGGTT